MTEHERVVIAEVLADLEAEEAEQTAQRGYASPRLTRATVRLTQLVDGIQPGSRPMAWQRVGST